MDVDASVWRGRRVLVTGHTGFKGAWLTLWLEHLGAEVTGLALPPAADGAWAAFAPGTRVRSLSVDLRHPDAMADAVRRADPEVVLHLAAQAIVRTGFEDPVGTYATNVLGTLHLLDALRSTGRARAIVVVTSDKVYDHVVADRGFVEDDRLGGADPYSSSKACAELAVAAWRAAFLASGGPRVATGRAGNVLGGGDRGRDRLGPDVQQALATGVPVRLRHPSATRPWQFVLDPLRGYLLLAQHLLSGAEPAVHAMNFGPTADVAVPVQAVVERLLDLAGRGSWKRQAAAGVPEAPSLRLDASLARKVLGWAPSVDLDRALDWTTAWWRTEAEGGDLRAMALSQIDTYATVLTA